jgi:hypothetical protein
MTLQARCCRGPVAGVRHRPFPRAEALGPFRPDWAPPGRDHEGRFLTVTSRSFSRSRAPGGCPPLPCRASEEAARVERGHSGPHTARVGESRRFTEVRRSETCQRASLPGATCLTATPPSGWLLTGWMLPEGSVRATAVCGCRHASLRPGRGSGCRAACLAACPRRWLRGRPMSGQNTVASALVPSLGGPAATCRGREECRLRVPRGVVSSRGTSRRR